MNLKHIIVVEIDTPRNYIHSHNSSAAST